jgi:hypothetical protein
MYEEYDMPRELPSAGN